MAEIIVAAVVRIGMDYHTGLQCSLGVLIEG